MSCHENGQTPGSDKNVASAIGHPLRSKASMERLAQFCEEMKNAYLVLLTTGSEEKIGSPLSDWSSVYRMGRTETGWEVWHNQRDDLEFWYHPERRVTKYSWTWEEIEAELGVEKGERHAVNGVSKKESRFEGVELVILSKL